MPRTDDVVQSDVSIITSRTARNVMCQYSIDLTHMRDPIGQVILIATCKDGTDKRVQEWIRIDPRIGGILHIAEMIVHDIFSNQKASWTSLGLSDFHGRWISPAIGEIIADELMKGCFKVCVQHLDLGGPTT